MARAVNDLSARANQSGALARASVVAAQQGQQAVQAALSVVADRGRRVRIAAESVDKGRGASPEMAKSATLLTLVAALAEALGGSASGRTLVELGERLHEPEDGLKLA
jgi:hypothetical protein